MQIETITAEEHKRLRAIVDKAEAYRAEVCGPHRNYLTAEEATHPYYAACNNEMRGRVVQYELLTDPPQRFHAYVGTSIGNNRYVLETWVGDPLGTITLMKSWPSRSYVGPRMYQAYAILCGRTYTGRTFGKGMCVGLRLTAESRRQLVQTQKCGETPHGERGA